jgi:hypothetical protein
MFSTPLRSWGEESGMLLFTVPSISFRSSFSGIQEDKVKKTEVMGTQVMRTQVRKMESRGQQGRL